MGFLILDLGFLIFDLGVRERGQLACGKRLQDVDLAVDLEALERRGEDRLAGQ